MKKKHEKAFTIIELIVVMAVIGILVLLAMPKFMGYTEKAKITEIKSNTKQVENASERYYMDKNDWPRLTDTPYTSAQITSFAQEITDKTGQIVTLDTTGNYYDIDYSKLQTYVQKPKDNTHYIIQNPVGEVYYLKDLTAIGENMLDDVPLPNNKPVAVITMNPGTALTTDTNITWIYSNSTDTDGDLIANAEWKNKQNIYSTAGSYIIELRVQDFKGLWSDWVSKTITVKPCFIVNTFNYTGSYQQYIVAAGITGIKIECYGASGGGNIYTWAGDGGYASGELVVTPGQILYVYVGGIGKTNTGTAGGAGGYNGGGNAAYGQWTGGAGGGGASDVRSEGTSLNNRIIVGAGGGGASMFYGQNGGGLEAVAYTYSGGPGTQSNGGARTGSSTLGTNGGFGYGGNGGAAVGNNTGGGGGGAGYYGGGGGGSYGGNAYSGGGGSSYLGTLLNTSTSSGVNVGNGKVVITGIN